MFPHSGIDHYGSRAGLSGNLHVGNGRWITLGSPCGTASSGAVSPEPAKTNTDGHPFAGLAKGRPSGLAARPGLDDAKGG